jgi:hypothetical protein
MEIPAQSRAAELLDRALDWTVAPEYSKVGYELRERIWAGEILELEGKTAIVTGATSGIGEAARVGMARGGAFAECESLAGVKVPTGTPTGATQT